MSECPFCGGDYKNVPAHKRFCKMNPDSLFNKKGLQSFGDMPIKDKPLIRVSPDTSKSSSAGAISEKIPTPPVVAGTPDTSKNNDKLWSLVGFLIVVNIIAVILNAAVLYLYFRG